VGKPKRGRPRKDGPRDRHDRLIRDGKFTPAPDHILEKRKLFSFVTPSKGPDGRTGEIDQDICDGIGQFHALGLLDGHGLDPQDLRDKGREWRNGYVMLLRKSGFKTGSYERMDKSKEDIRYTGRDAHFDRLDECLRGFERTVLLSLLVDPIVGSWPNGEEERPLGSGDHRRGIAEARADTAVCAVSRCERPRVAEGLDPGFVFYRGRELAE
jgi:hypothetical protein